MHRFGSVSGGFYEFFGLDQARTRLGLKYGITDRFEIGLGRSTLNKNIDGSIKWKILLCVLLTMQVIDIMKYCIHGESLIYCYRMFRENIMNESR